MRLALVAMLLLLPDVAAAKCMSKDEARERSGSHLYWSVGINGRCWASSMAAARAAAKGALHPKGERVKAPEPEARPMLPVALPPLEDVQWAWVTAARAVEIAPLTDTPLPLPKPPPPARAPLDDSPFAVLGLAAVLTALWLLFARRFLRSLFPW